MSYRVVIEPSARRKLNTLGLPDFLLIEAELRLRNDLTILPAQRLIRVQQPFEGVVYGFDLIDPDNRLCQHALIFWIMYGQDEETLHVVNVAYYRHNW